MTIQDKPVRLILAKCDTGAGKKGAQAGPQALLTELNNRHITFDDVISLEPIPVEESEDIRYCKHIETVKSNSENLSQAIVETVNANKLPVIFSGDHSNAIGGISGIKNAHPNKRIGVIWVDAHADLHSPYTTPSGNLHGMPLAAMLAQDNTKCAEHELNELEISNWNALKSIGQSASPKILGTDLVFIGIRDLEPEEWSLIDDLNIQYYDPDYIKEHGIYNVINNSVKHLEHCDLLYVSFDVDSMDPEMANGTGTPVPGGLSKTEAESVLKSLIHHPKLAALEITEINPSLDEKDQKMASLTADILAYAIR